MYHQIKPIEMFRERELALLEEAKNRRLLLGRRLRTGRTPKARSTIAAAVVGFVGALVVASLIMLAASSSPAHAQTTFLVNSIADQPDANTADGKCFALNTSCTLRAAIEQANATPEADVIDFSISGGEVQTITPSSALPPITDQVTIDGYSQPGASPNTLAKGTNAVLKVELDGANAGNGAPGLDVQASNTVIRGLVINRFQNVGVEVKRDARDVSIEGNFIGTDPSGTIDRGNLFDGVRLSSTSATVGGASPEKRNLISGNDFGVIISGPGSGNEVSGNLIGTKKDGLNPLGNANDGVFIGQSNKNLVGGTTAAAANTIAFNGANGVRVAGNTTFPANGNRILRNSIFFNGRLGIDLTGDGVTPNDLLDFDDPGSNALQNFPRITSAELASGQTTIKGRLNSIPGAVFTIKVFANPKGTNQGRIFLGQKRSISTDSNGNATFTLRPKKAVIVGNAITATATNELTGDTSEFSAAKAVVRQR